MKGWLIVLGCIVFAIFLLFISSKGVLISGKGPAREPGDGQDSLSCTYFTGAGTIERKYWYSSSGIFGRSACPRLVDL